MKNSIITTAAAILMMAFSFSNANAQVSCTGHISAEVVDAVTASISTSSIVNPNSNITPATFSVSSTQASTFAVNMPEGETTLTSADGLQTMTLTDWVLGQNNSVANNTQKVSIGATIADRNNETPKGVYSGSYKVTFSYN